MTAGKDKVGHVVRLGLVGLAGLLSVMSVAALASRQKGHKDIAAVLERYEGSEETEQQEDKTQEETAENDGKKDKDESKDENKPEDKKTVQEEQAERISKRHIFSPPKPEKKFSAKLAGVLGKQAFFEGESKGVEAGQSHKGAKIKEIGADWVEVEFEGKTQKLYVFGKGGVVSKPSKEPPKPEPAKTTKAPEPEPIKPPEMPKIPENIKVPSGFKITAEMIARFKSLSPEMQKQILERMPADMREQVEKEL